MSARCIRRLLRGAWLFGLLCLGHQVSAQTVYYVHTDALGSVVAESDSAGQVVSRREYEPYGQQLVPAVQDGPGYTGHVQDAATGLTYMQQRYYDPVLGVFLSIDPVTAYSSPTTQFHRYRYANNNPYKFTDPDGEASYVFWYSPTKAVVVIPYAVSDPHGAAKFTNAQVNAQIENAYSGRVRLNGRNIEVKAVGLPIALNAQNNDLPNVNVIAVNPSTTRSSTNDIGGNRVNLRSTADAGVVAHELGHAAGAGDQYAGGVDVNRNILPESYQATNSMMGVASGKANAQTMREILAAPSATQKCVPTGESAQCQ